MWSWSDCTCWLVSEISCLLHSLVQYPIQPTCVCQYHIDYLSMKYSICMIFLFQYKPATCEDKADNGDIVSVHYTVCTCIIIVCFSIKRGVNRNSYDKDVLTCLHFWRKSLNQKNWRILGTRGKARWIKTKMPSVILLNKTFCLKVQREPRKEYG